MTTGRTGPSSFTQIDNKRGLMFRLSPLELEPAFNNAPEADIWASSLLQDYAS